MNADVIFVPRFKKYMVRIYNGSYYRFYLPEHAAKIASEICDSINRAINLNAENHNS